MKKLIGILSILAAVTIIYGAVSLVGAEKASADPAFVLNSGRDGLTCTLSGTFSGNGHATLVANDGDQIQFSCSGSINETPPRPALVGTAGGPFGTACHLVITPSGNFSASCHN